MLERQKKSMAVVGFGEDKQLDGAKKKNAEPALIIRQRLVSNRQNASRLEEPSLPDRLQRKITSGSISCSMQSRKTGLELHHNRPGGWLATQIQHNRVDNCLCTHRHHLIDLFWLRRGFLWWNICKTIEHDEYSWPGLILKLFATVNAMLKGEIMQFCQVEWWSSRWKLIKIEVQNNEFEVQREVVELRRKCSRKRMNCMSCSVPGANFWTLKYFGLEEVEFGLIWEKLKGFYKNVKIYKWTSY